MAGQLLGVQAIEVRGAQVSVRDPFAEDVPHRDEDTVALGAWLVPAGREVQITPPQSTLCQCAGLQV